MCSPARSRYTEAARLIRRTTRALLRTFARDRFEALGCAVADLRHLVVLGLVELRFGRIEIVGVVEDPAEQRRRLGRTRRCGKAIEEVRERGARSLGVVRALRGGAGPEARVLSDGIPRSARSRAREQFVACC